MASDRVVSVSGTERGHDTRPRVGNAEGWRYDRSIQEQPDEVRLSVYREPGDGLAIYVTPAEYPADEFRIFLGSRDMLRLAVVLLVGALRWRKPRPWDADMSPEDRATDDVFGAF